jgi:thiol-disulfide isomerase/thioredoxin
MIFIDKESDLSFDDMCVLYFYASWYPYNKKMLIMLDKMEQKYNHIKFFAINVDDFKQVTKRFAINSVPTVLIFNKKELKRITGLVLTSVFRSVFADICSVSTK